jgi:DNA-binding NtrC family response regulator
VTQNRGFIRVTSAPGSGTTFAIHLPRHDGPAAAAAPAPPMREGTGGSETILIVEDEAQLLQLAKVALERWGYRAHTASSPADALAFLERTDVQIDLLLTDVVMPGMNGNELKERLAQRQPGLKVLFMSGYAPRAVAQRGILDDGVDFLPKPFTLDDLGRKIREVLDRSSTD